jgi:hypothetical protein
MLEYSIKVFISNNTFIICSDSKKEKVTPKVIRKEFPLILIILSSSFFSLQKGIINKNNANTTSKI